MEWLDSSMVDKLLSVPFLVALGGICVVFYKIILAILRKVPDGDNGTEEE